MEAFPFTPEGWAPVSATGTAIVNASLADDGVVRASSFAKLQAVLAGLRDRDGEHPILLETETDFTDDAGDRVRLYRLATEAATSGGLQTLTIRLSLAEVLLHELGRPVAARVELLACQKECGETDDESDKKNWSNLPRECERAISGS